jgi:hypothetical protein
MFFSWFFWIFCRFLCFYMSCSILYHLKNTRF